MFPSGVSEIEVIMALTGLGRSDLDPELARIQSIVQPIMLSHDRGSGASTALREALLSLQPQLQQLTHERTRTELAGRLNKDSLAVICKGLEKKPALAAELMQEWRVVHPQ